MKWYQYNDEEGWVDPTDCADYWNYDLDKYKSTILTWDYEDIKTKQIVYFIEYRKWVAHSYKENMYLPFIFNNCNLTLTLK